MAKTMDGRQKISSGLELPGLIRMKDAPKYLGMDKNRFNQVVRPNLIEIPIGERGIAFDRIDLDGWIAHYKACNGRPASETRRQLWEKNVSQGYKKSATFGTSTRKSTETEFAKALELTRLRKQKDI